MNDQPQIIRFRELIAEAHKHGLKSIQTHAVQYPAADNGQRAIFRAEIELQPQPEGPLLHVEATGDADPNNVSKMVVGALIRMAETRAVARALRWATGLDGVADVEMPDYTERPVAQPQSRPAASPRSRQSAPLPEGPASEAQRKAVIALCSQAGIVPPDTLAEWSAQKAAEWIEQRQKKNRAENAAS